MAFSLRGRKLATTCVPRALLAPNSRSGYESAPASGRSRDTQHDCAGIILPKELPEHDSRVTQLAVALAATVHLFGLASVVAAGWFDTTNWFQASLFVIFSFGMTAYLILAVVCGFFTTKRQTVLRTDQPVEFWVSYWIWIIFLLAADSFYLMSIFNKTCE